MNIFLIAALANNRVIGKEGKIPWHLKEDLAHFKKLTSNSVVIMGRKTYESIGKPLSNRINLVMTRNAKEIKDLKVVPNSKVALEVASTYSKDIFIIGGENIYREFLPFSTKMFLTEVEIDINGDTFFPQWDKQDWTEVSREKKIDAENKIKFSFIEYKRVT